MRHVIKNLKHHNERQIIVSSWEFWDGHIFKADLVLLNFFCVFDTQIFAASRCHHRGDFHYGVLHIFVLQRVERSKVIQHTFSSWTVSCPNLDYFYFLVAAYTAFCSVFVKADRNIICDRHSIPRFEDFTGCEPCIFGVPLLQNSSVIFVAKDLAEVYWLLQKSKLSIILAEVTSLRIVEPIVDKFPCK